MRTAIVILIVAAGCRSAPAPKALEQRVTLAPGLSVSRRCFYQRLEGVDAAGARPVDRAALDSTYLERVRGEVAVRFWPSPTVHPRQASLAMIVQRDGTISRLGFFERSGADTFDLHAEGAVVGAGLAHALPPLPRSAPDSVPLLVSFGRRVDDTAPLYEERLVCPAVELPDNPRPTYPEELRRIKRQGVVIARFTVDTLGMADLETVEVSKSDHSLFTAAVTAALPYLRFAPAEARGRKVAQTINARYVFHFAQRSALGDMLVASDPFGRRPPYRGR